MTSTLQPPSGGDSLRASVRAGLCRALGDTPGLVSLSLVGSFCENPSLEAVSDIDLIVVVETLTPDLFRHMRESVQALQGEDLGLPGYHVLVNDGFGPRKFDRPSTLVVHLMVYDRAGHREHVLNSPFTCLDWECTEVAERLPLATVYPVIWLRPRDFSGARRGLLNHLEDLQAGTMSFREYEETGHGGLRQVERSHPLDARAAGEFAFHIIRFLVGNYAKLLTRRNVRLSPGELEIFWPGHLPACAAFLPFFRELHTAKRTRTAPPPDTLARTMDFLRAFSEDLDRHWKIDARSIVFYRHAPTALNDGRFLGRGSDPGLLQPLALAPAPSANAVYSSPLRRAKETAGRLWPGTPAIPDPRLAEIDYGEAEGLDYPALRDLHPGIVKAWAKGEDPRFPRGENTGDVLARLDDFLQSWVERGGTGDAVVTHNVVIRCLLGKLLDLPMREWHVIPVPHLQAVEIKWRNGMFHADLAPGLREALLDAVATVRGGAHDRR